MLIRIRHCEVQRTITVCGQAEVCAYHETKERCPLGGGDDEARASSLLSIVEFLSSPLRPLPSNPKPGICTFNVLQIHVLNISTLLASGVTVT
jgi:hypothetical protein